jgi:signal transduction histidine kinase
MTVKEVQEKEEFQRILKLAEYDLDYSKDFKDLDDLTKLAAHIVGTEISLINIVGPHTQWSISNYGFDVDQMPREESICNHTIQDDAPFEVPELDKDDRFKEKEYVTSDPNLRYYFGVPLKSIDGHRIGALCVLDTKTRSITPEKVEMFNIIAEEVMRRLEHLKLIKELKMKLDEADEVSRKVSHDIRGPIGGIIGLSQLIKENAEREDLTNIIELIEMINRGGKTVLELADEILSTHKEIKQDPISSSESLALTQLKEKLVDLYKPQAQLKNVSFDVTLTNNEFNENIPKRKLLQIFGNLITNAIKFTDNGGSVHVALQMTEDSVNSGTLHFEVKDTGIGISEEQKNLLLSDKSFSTKGTSNERGFGFGFQLAHHLVQSMNGKLNIESEIDKGTTIKVELPVRIYSK